ncbi:MAG: phosphoribosylanthranilate isomerase [Pseudomonadota bacterium]
MDVKICGITDRSALGAAVSAGAAFVGFVFFPKSPRNLDLATAAVLSRHVPDHVGRVALVVNADDDTLDAITSGVGLDMLQLHGAETPSRVAAVRARTGLPVMKAVGVATADDLPALDTYGAVADRVLVDAKPPPGAALPGGNGLAFDWELISGRRWAGPWMLAGGLTPENAADAARLTGANALDVSSGVERSPGLKDPDRIADFMAALRPHA